MANFFYATAVYADGRVEEYQGTLWYLCGRKCVEGHRKLQELRSLEDEGIIVSLHVDYES